MNIKDHYSTMSRLYLHQTILCLAIFALIMLPANAKIPFLPVSAAGLFSLSCVFWFFAKYGYYAIRTSSLPAPALKRRANPAQFILIPSPANESLLHYYSSNGVIAFTAEIRKGKAGGKFGSGLLLTDRETKKEWSFLFGKTEIGLLAEKEAFSIPAMRLSKREAAYRLDGSEFLLESAPFRMRIFKDGHLAASIGKGEMPLSLQAYYSSNAPLVKLDSRLSEIEKVFLLGLMASEY